MADRIDALRAARSVRRRDRLRAAGPAAGGGTGCGRRDRLRAASPLITLPHAALLGAALSTAAALAAHHQTGGPAWPALGWAAAGAIGCCAAAIDTTYRLVRWRAQVVLDSAPDELAALRERHSAVN